MDGIRHAEGRRPGAVAQQQEATEAKTQKKHKKQRSKAKQSGKRSKAKKQSKEATYWF
jgi:hypothetical protein